MNDDKFVNLIKYYQSTAEEFEAIKNKVRNLIGMANKPEDGRYRESILKSILRRYLPKNYEIGTGFVVRDIDISKEPDYSVIKPEHSKQIDIIIYEFNRPVLFKEGDFVILTPESISGIIEVKGNIQNRNLTKIIEIANENGRFISEAKVFNKNIFNGIFGFDGYENIETIKKHVENSLNASACTYLSNPSLLNVNTYLVNHIAFNQDSFLKYWKKDLTYSLYKLDKLCYSYFIFNLILYLSRRNSRATAVDENIYFPLDKENYRNYDFSFEKTKDKFITKKIR